MTLDEMIAAKYANKTEVIHCVDKEYTAVSMITLCPWQEGKWVLPWSRLDAIRFSDVEDSEQVELFFPHHHVIAVGENLRQFDEPFREYMISCLRSMPVTHRASLKPSAPFIARLEVRLLADPKGVPAIDVPF